MTSSLASENELTNTGEVEAESSTSSLSVLGSLFGAVVTGLVGSANFLFSLLSSRKVLKTIENKNGKRKRFGSGGDDEDEEEEEQEEELEMKRWRPDKVYEAVQYFINNLLGEKDSNENIKTRRESQDENMNTNSVVIGETNWNKRPEINFFSDSFASSIHDIEENNAIKKTSTPQIYVEEEAASDVFVFSAEKNSATKNVEDDNSMSHSTFEEKQAYFKDQIQIQEAKAKATERRSPSPCPR